MPLPVLGVAARLIVSKGVREATKKYGKTAVKKAQGQIKKREAAEMEVFKKVAREIASKKIARFKKANKPPSKWVRSELKSRRRKKLAKAAATTAVVSGGAYVGKEKFLKKRTSKRKSR